MSQQINLLNPDLIKKDSLLSQTNIALAAGLFLFATVGFYIFENNYLMELESQNIATAHQLSDLKETINQLVAKQHNQQGKTSTLATKIEALERKKMHQQAIINSVNQNSIKTGQSYAALLRAFSKQSLDGLWITGLSIDQDAQNLSIKGRTLNADLVPEFIAKLRAEPALNGKTFTDLNMVKVTPEPVKETTQSVKVNKPKSDAAATLMPAEVKVAIQQPEYIEFTLQSIPATDTEESLAQNNQQLAGANH